MIAENITAATIGNLPAATEGQYKLNVEVFVYDEQSQQWKAPYVVLDGIDRRATVVN